VNSALTVRGLGSATTKGNPNGFYAMVTAISGLGSYASPFQAVFLQVEAIYAHGQLLGCIENRFIARNKHIDR
jgi:hypothetical protein